MMHAPKVILLLVLTCCQFYTGCASEDTKESLSRAKRANTNYEDMLRYGRGLHMLRLGKRDGDSTERDIEYLEELLSLPESYGEQSSPYNEQYLPYNRQFYLYPYYVDHYDDADISAESEIPNYGRFKRSTSEADQTLPSQLQNNAEEQQPAAEYLKDEDLYWSIPDDNGYSYLVPREMMLDLDSDASSWETADKFGLRKRQLPMLRLGKRSLGMLRLGKREPKDEDEKRSLGMLRLGKRQLTMLRLGKRSLGMLRLGKRLEDGNSDDKKRSLGMLRLGKRLDNAFTEEEKRSLGMLRLGKRQLAMLRLGKKSLGMLRLGKREFEEDKKSLGMLRLGKREDEKRSLGMLRLGKRQELGSSSSEQSHEKRPMSMLRLGKREDEEKRSLGMLRLGKREDEEKRSLGMLRLGKRSTV